jgi:hypothetical protein
MLQDLLLEISTNKCAAAELELKFDIIAAELLHKTKLVSGSKEYLIREIEFYFYSEHYEHMDPYVHAKGREDHQQSKFGKWYFHHKFYTVKRFYRDRRKGIDITFGNKEHSNYGGILLRKIERIGKDYESIKGISRIVDALLSNIEPLANEDISVFAKNSILRLEEFSNSDENPIDKN